MIAFLAPSGRCKRAVWFQRFGTIIESCPSSKTFYYRPAIGISSETQVKIKSIHLSISWQQFELPVPLSAVR